MRANSAVAACRVLLWVGAWVSLASTVHGEVLLIDNGQARCRIYVPAGLMAEDPKPGAPSTEAERQRQRLRESVRDLSWYLEQMSGAATEIAVDSPKPGGPPVAILIGRLAEQEFGPPQQAYPFKQGFRVVVTPGKVGLWGESDLATSYAIYEVLDRLGCRWFMPGELGQCIPHLPTIGLAESDVSSAPGTIYRGIWYCDEAYKRRNRLGGLQLQAGHALEGYVSNEQRAAHPEWVAEVHGKPHPRRLKWSNPEVAEAIADYWLTRLEKEPVDSISLSPDDGIDFDESAEDRAIDAGDIDTTSQDVSLTDRLLVLCNRVAERVTAKHPDVLFGMLAYGPTTRPPVREKVHSNIVPQIAPITYSRAHPMTDDNVPDNRQLRALVEGWGRAARSTSVYFYAWFLAEPAAPNPMIAKWSADVPLVLQNNCRFWQPETLPNFETSMHALYLGCRLAWNPQLKPADVIAEINSRFYGGAGQAMTAYWNFIDEVWVQTPEYSGCGFAYLRRWTPQRLQQARQLMNAALAACQTVEEVERVKLADASLEQLELFMKLRRDLAEGRFAHLAADGDYWRERMHFLGIKHQEQYCFTRMPWAPATTLSGGYFNQFYHQTYQDAARVANDFAIITPQPLREFRYQADADKHGEAQGWATPEFDDGSWKVTDVCIDSWSALGYHAWFKSMWYRAQVKLPALRPGKKVYLWIGATDGSAKLFVNGRHVPYADEKKGTLDEFNGYCQPVSFDVTEAVKSAANNQIALLCTRTFFNELGTGGLLAPVVIYSEK